jgi:hypothetical protein
VFAVVIKEVKTGCVKEIYNRRPGALKRQAFLSVIFRLERELGIVISFLIIIGRANEIQNLIFNAESSDNILPSPPYNH